jgi:hypothetical protein
MEEKVNQNITRPETHKNDFSDAFAFLGNGNPDAPTARPNGLTWLGQSGPKSLLGHPIRTLLFFSRKISTSFN